MTTAMNNGTNKNGRLSRPTLSGQIDRLDAVIDGLSEALNESVADAVRDVVGQVVRESVEAAVRDVLDDPELIRAALARHAPVAALAPDAGPAPQRQTLTQALARTLGWICALAAGKANDAGAVLGWGWTWCVKKGIEAAGAIGTAWNATAAALPWLGGLAWKHKRTCAAALGVGTLVGVLAYCAGPAIASACCGLAGAAASLGGLMLASVCRPSGGR